MIEPTPAARDELLSLRREDLAALLRGGHAIDPVALDDTVYRGISLGLPRFMERLTWKTFQKVFHRDRTSGVLRGWNVRIEQHGLEGPSIARRRRGAPWTFGHYRVVDPAGHRVPAGTDRGLLLHYGLGENALLDPIRRVRDPLVALHPGSVELLLGWTYLELGPVLLGTPSYFLLEREGALGGGGGVEPGERRVVARAQSR